MQDVIAGRVPRDSEIGLRIVPYFEPQVVKHSDGS